MPNPDQSQPITLDCFCKELMHKLTAFKVEWQRKHHEQPNDYPMTFESEDEWIEQFAVYLGSGEC